MLDLNLAEAQLFRLAGGFFGSERVLLKMSVLAVCGGTLPNKLEETQTDLYSWARSNTCLITVVDFDDNPRMVIEFFSGFEDSVEQSEVEHQRFLKPILQAAGVPYVTISPAEFNEILDPAGNLDFFHLLKSKFLEYEGAGLP